MSYEGYTQNICANGHYWEIDAFDSHDCFDCKSPAAWSNAVDETNCDGWGYVPTELLDVASEARFETCNLGHTHQISPVLYHIPLPDETLMLRTFRAGERVLFFCHDRKLAVDQQKWATSPVDSDTELE